MNGLVVEARETLEPVELQDKGVMEPHRRGPYRKAPCSCVYLVYSLYQLRVGILPPYALNPYDRSHNVLQTPRIHTLYSYCPRPVILRCAFFLLPTLSLRPILRLCNTVGAARSSVSTSYLLYTSKEPIIVRRDPLLATILNLKNNSIPILNLRR